MSDHENVSDPGYDTPVPELDDHRRRPSIVAHHEQLVQQQQQQQQQLQQLQQQGLARSRRGTFDSLYGAHNDHLDRGMTVPGSGDAASAAAASTTPSGVRVRDFFEDAVEDGDAVDVPPGIGAAGTVGTVDARRMTAGTVRSESPPNSVKAFAEARRRREREASFSSHESKAESSRSDLHRTFSGLSRQSRPRTIDHETASLSSNKSAEEDVCFPMPAEHRNDKLYIDFDYLETFMEEEREMHEAAHDNAEARVFPDLRPQASSSQEGAATPMVTADGDFVGAPASDSDEHMHDEKEKEDNEKENADKPNMTATNVHLAGATAAAAAAATAGASAAKPVQHMDPNRFSFFSSAWESTIHAAEFSDLVLPGENVRGLFSFPAGGETDGVWWLNVNSPTETEARALCRAFGIHPLTVEDITQQETREKIEIFPSYYFASFRSFNVVLDEDGEVEYEPFHTYVVVFREGTLSFSFAPNAHASKVRTRISLLKDYVALSSDWICYALIDDIVDSFAPVIHDIEMQTERLEDDVFVARTDDMNRFLRKIGNTRKNVMGLMRLLGGKADVLRGFTKRCNENYRVTPRMDIGLYLGDIQDHVVTMMNNLGHCEKMLSRTHSNYLAQLSIDSITQGTNTNRVLSKITFIASIVVPLNVITGLFGMNVKVPFNEVENLHAFFSILGGLVGFCIISLIVARRMHYI